ncbi:M15 family metallopeptidase [Sphingomonas aracearum]|uniref:D-alanyl-D-alanine carboxypeptidase family protein n=1 Tax=Sphingomonas aracearum TaxID=2283317 RepID=A0A369VW90_9SPHN|nr:M15 family metallopeptidase [Sphingomonas aracearum]RDE06099.1 D-alanyl-D-alanine carboxypeptidase family protein [Sphingomonas aracearum]
MIGGIGRLFAWAAALLPTASAQAHVGAILLCTAQFVAPGGDGRLLGHLPYAEAPSWQLVAIPGFGYSKECRVHRDMAPDLLRLLEAANQVPEVKGRLFGISCHRSVAYQSQVFCRGVDACHDAAARARSSGPPGFSEHATGYALDFAVADRGCAVLSPCLANTPAGRWLIANGPRFGFEMSFPHDNAQGVTWEPWHWRWVGYAITEPGAAAARVTFVRARRQFPGEPRVNDAGDRWIQAVRLSTGTPLTGWRAPAAMPAPVPTPAPTPPPTPSPWRSPVPTATPTPWRSPVPVR